MIRTPIRRSGRRGPAVHGGLAAFTALAMLVGCGDGADDAAVGGPGAGGTAIVGKRTDFGGFNSITNTDIYTDEVIKYALFTPLIQHDEDLEVVPYLAREWELEGDTAIVFELRRDVHWHDGPPVTAEDVKFTFDLAKDEATASLLGSAYLGEVEAAEVVDSFTVRFDFVRPHSQPLEDFWWAPMPRHLLEDIPAAELRNAEFNRNPVGSGPYRFVEWQANSRLVLERNPDFPEALGGPPRLERVAFRIVPEPATLLTELLTGGIHVDVPVEPDQAQDVEAGAGTELFAYPGRTVYYLGWNNQREPFTDATVRRALTLAVDRPEIVEALLFGYGTVATSTIPPWSEFAPEVEPLPYDPERARALLQEAGWIDRDDDGVRENEAGEPFQFTLLTAERPLNRSVAQVVQSDLREVGIGVQIRVLEFQTFLSQHRSRDFDAVFSNWVLDNFQMASAPMSLFHSSEADVALSANRSGVRNPRLDSLMEAALTAPSPQEAEEIWAEFVEALQAEQPFTFMFWLDELAAAREGIQGVVMDPRGELTSIADWWLAGDG